MTRLRSVALTAGLLTALTLTGCELPGANGSSGSEVPLWDKVATDTLNCIDDRVTVVDFVDDYDFDGDLHSDYFVTRRCTSTVPGSPKGGQLEVFRGGSAPEHPTRLAVIMRNWLGYTLDGCVTQIRGTVYTVGTKGTVRVLWEARRTPGGATAAPAKDQRRYIGCT